MTFVDDYAHLPGEVRAALAAARAAGWGRVVAVFQPHRYTRTAALARGVRSGVRGRGRRHRHRRLRRRRAARARRLGAARGRRGRGPDPSRPVRYAAARRAARTCWPALLRPGDLCCTLGAGDLTTPSRRAAGLGDDGEPDADALGGRSPVAGLGDRAERGRPLGPLTTYRVGGAARRSSSRPAPRGSRGRRRRRSPAGTCLCSWSGKGSNLLVADAGVRRARRAPGAGVRATSPSPRPPSETVIVRGGGRWDSRCWPGARWMPG